MKKANQRKSPIAIKISNLRRWLNRSSQLLYPKGDLSEAK